ncbi:hypothetical protein [Clostridium omnivorum]|uniref:Transcriptional regulator n=1 Tax=Clostridium omnivorum TaxID=1604902 RepID=A0ABQ5NCI9_9CLOT|nr:hypothetical protein [Clostridium sp. E14]GLC32876.1 hypothetical protein bsdE14_42860 [Clostridium sp. E14]
MKKVKSYSLSEDAIKEVIRIKELKGYKSESDALESIILNKVSDDERIKKIVLEILKENQLAVTNQSNTTPVEETIKDEVEQNLLNSMNDIFKRM